MSFLWDAFQAAQFISGVVTTSGSPSSSQLDARMDRIQDAQARDEAAQRVAIELDEKINRLALICRAIFELLQPSSGISEAQLAAKIHEIDERDGAADGRMTPRGQVCPKCGATMSPRFGRCLFCGYQDPSASPFVP